MSAQVFTVQSLTSLLDPLHSRHFARIACMGVSCFTTFFARMAVLAGTFCKEVSAAIVVAQLQTLQGSKQSQSQFIAVT